MWSAAEPQGFDVRTAGAWLGVAGDHFADVLEVACGDFKTEDCSFGAAALWVEANGRKDGRCSRWYG